MHNLSVLTACLIYEFPHASSVAFYAGQVILSPLAVFLSLTSLGLQCSSMRVQTVAEQLRSTSPQRSNGSKHCRLCTCHHCAGIVETRFSSTLAPFWRPRYKLDTDKVQFVLTVAAMTCIIVDFGVITVFVNAYITL